MKSNGRGFSLIEMVVVGGLATIALVGTMSLFSNLNRSQSSATQSIEFDNLAIQLRMVLQNPLTCAAALQTAAGVQIAPPSTLTVALPDLPVAGLSIGKISIGSFTLDTATPFNGLKIDSITMKQIAGGTPLFGSLIPYTTNLEIRGTKSAAAGKVATGGGVLRRDIPLSVTVQVPLLGGPSTIIACSTLGGAGGGVAPPPICTGTNALHWNGGAWSCDPQDAQGGTPCGPGGRGLTMYGIGIGGTTRVCCFVTDYFGTGFYKNFVDCTGF